MDERRFEMRIEANTLEDFQAAIEAWSDKLADVCGSREAEELLKYPDCSGEITSARNGASRVCNAALRLEMGIDKGTYEQALDDVINVVWKCNDFINWLGVTNEDLHEAYKRVCVDE